MPANSSRASWPTSGIVCSVNRSCGKSETLFLRPPKNRPQCIGTKSSTDRSSRFSIERIFKCSAHVSFKLAAAVSLSFHC